MYKQDEQKKDRKEAEQFDGMTIETMTFEGRADKDYVPEGFESKEHFLQDMRENYEADVDYDRENREAAIEDKKFSAGEQWDPVVLQQREGLPCLVINNIPQFTAQLVGDWRESRKAIKVVPSNEEDTDVASIRGDLIRSIEMQSRSDRVYDNAFESVVQCGDGAFRVAVEYARDDVFDQDLFLRPIDDALSVVWDRYAMDPTGRDAKRVYVNDRIPKKEYNRKYGDVTPDALDTADLIHNLHGSTWCDDESYQITEYWRLIQRQVLLGLFQNGKVFQINDDNLSSLVEANGYPVKTRASWCSYAQMHLVTGFDILAGPYEYKLNRVPIIRMSGRVTSIGNRRIRYGMVRYMKDAARLKNFWRSVAAEQLGYAPKAKWMATAEAVEGREDDIRKAHTSRDPILIFNDEAEFGRNVQRVDPPGVEAALLNEASINTQDMKDVTGIHDASLGIRSNETSGRAIMARQREGDIANLTFHDNANAAVLEAGDVLNQLIPQIYDGTRIVRTVGEDESVKFQKLNDPYDPEAVDMSVGMFDVALSTGTSYTTRRVEAAQAMMDAIQVWPQLMSVAGDLVAKAQDWPGADKLAERLKKTIPPQYFDEGEEGVGLGITPEQLQEMQAALQKLELENQELKLKQYNKDRELEVDAYNAETQRIRALTDHEVDQNELGMKYLQTIIDGAKTLDDQDIRRDEISEKLKAMKEKNSMPAAKPSTPAAG